MQYAILKKVVVFPDESEIKSLNSTFLMQSFEFFEKFQSLEEKNPQQRTNALFSRFFESELHFHVRKEPQNDPKKSKKGLAVVRQISDFLLKVTKNS